MQIRTFFYFAFDVFRVHRINDDFNEFPSSFSISICSSIKSPTFCNVVEMKKKYIIFL